MFLSRRNRFKIQFFYLKKTFGLLKTLVDPRGPGFSFQSSVLGKSLRKDEEDRRPGDSGPRSSPSFLRTPVCHSEDCLLWV